MLTVHARDKRGQNFAASSPSIFISLYSLTPIVIKVSFKFVKVERPTNKREERKLKLKMINENYANPSEDPFFETRI